MLAHLKRKEKKKEEKERNPNHDDYGMAAMTIFIQIKWWPDMFTYGCLISSFMVKEF